MTPVRTLPLQSRVAYCAACDIYVDDEKEAGERCYSVDCHFTLRLRVGYICLECECRNIFFDREAYLNHRCEDY
mgnify:CR=1 FL=1